MRSFASAQFGAAAVIASVAISLLVPSANAQAATTTAAGVLASLTVSPEISAPYNRDYFQHWIDADANGCDSRQEVLIAESRVPATVGDGCDIGAGEWYSPYDGATWTDPGDVDIDHAVALSEAWQSGAAAWTALQRRDFANDLSFPGSLIAVTDNVNASKGDSDAAQWSPPLSTDLCRYATDQVLVKYRWNLAVDTAESTALARVLTGECGSAAVDLPEKQDTSTPTTPSATDRMQGGSELAAAAELISPENGYRLVMQSDGNAVVYEASGAPIWNSRTFRAGSHLSMQTDGNLVVYTPTGQPVWNTGTFGRPGATLVMQSDGNLVLYSANGAPLWWSQADSAGLIARPAPAPAPTPTSNTLQGGQTLTAGQRITSNNGNQAVMQGDGNFVVYSAGRALWNSGTSIPGSRMSMQTDGNAVVYSPSGAPLWNSGTPGNTGSRMVMQDDGNLVIYRTNGSPAWNSIAASAPPPAPTPPPTAPTPPPTAPTRPADADCGDFATWQAANAFYRYWYTWYGDFSDLDGNADGVPCESLPGAP